MLKRVDTVKPGRSQAATVGRKSSRVDMVRDRSQPMSMPATVERARAMAACSSAFDVANCGASRSRELVTVRSAVRDSKGWNAMRASFSSPRRRDSVGVTSASALVSRIPS